MHTSAPAVGKLTLKTDESLLVDEEMIDDDNGFGVEAEFSSQSSLKDGVSGRKSIDTSFENTSVTEIQTPRSAQKEIPLRGMTASHEGVNNPAPTDEIPYMYPHRKD